MPIDSNLGYEYIYDPDNPKSNKAGKIYVHRMVMENFLGRDLLSDEVVHHKNGNRSDNRIDNLEVMTSLEHFKLHAGEKPEIKCLICGRKHKNKKYCSGTCAGIGLRKVPRPSKDELKSDMNNISWLAIGRKYGVSDNAARKWARKYNLI